MACTNAVALMTHSDKTLDECKAICAKSPDCKGFDFYTFLTSNGKGKKGEC